MNVTVYQVEHLTCALENMILDYLILALNRLL